MRPNDVLVASFPKSGTTWLQEIVNQIVQPTSTSSRDTLEDLFPYLEYVHPGLKELSKKADPRSFKTHLQFEALPVDILDGTGKVVDTILFHFHKDAFSQIICF